MAQIQSTHWEKQMNITLMLSVSYYYSSCDTHSYKLGEEYKSMFACKFSIKSAANDSSSFLNLNCHSDLNWWSCEHSLGQKCIFRQIHKERHLLISLQCLQDLPVSNICGLNNKCCLIVLQTENSCLVCMSGVCVMD